jgi:hypothetical protein
MPPSSRSALKEWAAIEGALATGRLTLLVRKGGIYEKRGGFEVEHRDFWIFPTGWHQNESELAPAFLEHLGDTPRFPPNQVSLRVHCTVVDALRIGSLDAVQRLGELQPFTGETLRSRFEYRDRPYLHVLVVRARVLPQPRVVANTPAYEGCISWVALDEEVTAEGATPVLTDEEFAAAREEILMRVGPHPAA